MKFIDYFLKAIAWIFLIMVIISSIMGIAYVYQNKGNADNVSFSAIAIVGLITSINRLPYSQEIKTMIVNFTTYGLVIYLSILLIYYGDRIRKFAGWAILVTLALAWLLPKFLYWQAGGR